MASRSALPLSFSIEEIDWKALGAQPLESETGVFRSTVQEPHTERTHSPHFVQLKRLSYLDPAGKRRVWECASRTTTVLPLLSSSATAPSAPVQLDLVDGEEVVAFYSNSSSGTVSERSLVLVLQYRPPLRAVALEFPAGLVDPGEQEHPGEAARRELREECGLDSTAPVSCSPALAYEPGLTDSRCRLVVMHVDGDAPQPPAAPEEDEFIQVLVVPLTRLRLTCDLLSLEHAVVIDAKVYSFLLGYEAACV